MTPAAFTPDVVQEELPNRRVTNGARRALTALLDGVARGQKVVRAAPPLPALGERRNENDAWNGCAA